MSVDLTTYTQALQTEVSPPGGNNFPTATIDDWINTLLNAFWEARLDGLLATFTMDANGIITPVLTTSPPQPDIGRDMIQLIVLYGSFAVIRNSLRSLRTMFSATAGPVKFEYQQSANVLAEIMKDLITRRDILLTRLSDLGSTTVTMIDSIIARDQSIMFQNTYWVGQGDNIPGGLYGLTG